MSGEANPDGATNVHDIGKILGTPLEPEQPTSEIEAGVDKEKVETPSGDTEPKPNRFTARFGDQDVELEVLTEGVDMSLMPKGIMLETDYRKKTAEVADSRREVDGKLTELTAALDNAKLLIEMDLDSLEANTTLKEDDPEAYLSQLDAIQDRAKKYQTSKEKVETELSTKRQGKLSDQAKLLDAAIPDWLDADVKKSDFEKILKTMKGVGYDNEALSGVDDHRVFVLARKAALYDEIMSKDLDGKRNDKEPGKNLEPGAKTDKQINDEITTARQRLKKGGKVKDLASVFSESRKG